MLPPGMRLRVSRGFSRPLRLRGGREGKVRAVLAAVTVGLVLDRRSPQALAVLDARPPRHSYARNTDHLDIEGTPDSPQQYRSSIAFLRQGPEPYLSGRLAGLAPWRDFVDSRPRNRIKVIHSLK